MTEVGGGWRPVYRVVRRIPAGRVGTYGQIAALAGMPGAARQVGWALSALGDEDDVPWHRVINAQGEISPRTTREIVDLQRALLESEGVDFNQRGKIDLARYAWVPGRRKKTPSPDSSSRKTSGVTTGKATTKSSRKTTGKSRGIAK